MATFKYTAQTQEGLRVRGVVDAPNEFAAAGKIREEAPIILSLEEVREKKSILDMKIGGNSLNYRNLAVLCSQLSITLRAGVPIARCMSMIAAQTADKNIRSIFEQAANDVEAGGGVAASLQKYGPNLPPTFIETIRAGEQSGNIENSFAGLADYYDKQYRNNAKIRSALTYPIFVVVVAIVVLIIVMAFVMPTLANTFADLGGELPLMTKVMIQISRFFQKAWIFIVVAILAAVIGWNTYAATEKGKEVRGRMQLSMPVWGRIHQFANSASFANTMSMMLQSGLTVDQAIDTTSKTLNNYILQQETKAILPKIEEGHSLGDCMKACGHFPQTLREMCAIGEETGELDSTLNVIGDLYANETDVATQNAINKLEPTLLIAIAILAGFLVISIYLPMFTMYNLM